MLMLYCAIVVLLCNQFLSKKAPYGAFLLFKPINCRKITAPYYAFYVAHIKGIRHDETGFSD